MKVDVIAKEVSKQDVTRWYKYLLGVLERKPRIQGYALSQDKIDVAAFICRYKGIVTFMANPKILMRIGRRTSLEGCESVKGHYKVKRPLLVRVEYYDEMWERKVRWFTWRMSRIICHEYDHLRNLTIADIGKRWWGDRYESRLK